MPEMILCAAIQVAGITLSVPRPGRHHTIINGFYAGTGRLFMTIDDVFIERAEQGFLTNRGRFVSRKEAWILATEAGQVTHPAGNDGPENGITSESMW